MREPSHVDAFDFLAEAPTIRDAAELERRFAAVLAAFGFDRFVCARLDPASSHRPTILATKGVAEWDQYMLDQGYIEHNPCRRWMDSGRDTFTWREVQGWNRHAAVDSHPKELKMWDDAGANGMKDGLTISSPGSTGQVMATRMMTDQPMIRSVDRPILESLAIVFATLRLRLHEQADDRPLNSVLTAREAECLRWASRGLTDYAIAEQMGVSAKTVNFHMENARRKLGAPNRLAAYHRAIELDALA